MYDCMITRITTWGRIYCFEKWILFFVAQEIWTKVIYRSHEEYKIFFSKLSLFLNCHENRKPNIYLYFIYFSLGIIQRMRKICGHVHKLLLFFTRLAVMKAVVIVLHQYYFSMFTFVFIK